MRSSRAAVLGGLLLAAQLLGGGLLVGAFLVDALAPGWVSAQVRQESAARNARAYLESHGEVPLGVRCSSEPQGRTVVCLYTLSDGAPKVPEVFQPASLAPSQVLLCGYDVWPSWRSQEHGCQPAVLWSTMQITLTGPE